MINLDPKEAFWCPATFKKMSFRFQVVMWVLVWFLLYSYFRHTPHILDIVGNSELKYILTGWFIHLFYRTILNVLEALGEEKRL